MQFNSIFNIAIQYLILGLCMLKSDVCRVGELQCMDRGVLLQGYFTCVPCSGIPNTPFQCVGKCTCVEVRERPGPPLTLRLLCRPCSGASRDPPVSASHLFSQGLQGLTSMHAFSRVPRIKSSPQAHKAGVLLSDNPSATASHCFALAGLRVEAQLPKELPLR